ncbi:oligogalacturonate lyase family protein [Consotaella aegiceratis]|uniref:oligogalacturonate lyase family protein n=1 Tax=Consotaella aegiceratis TaxID=3097961 RepID=UPI002F3EFDE7
MLDRRQVIKASLVTLAASTGVARPTMAAAAKSNATGESSPENWVDDSTGHRIVRLSSEPGTKALYFNQNGYTPEGDILIVHSPSGISGINLATREQKPILERPNIKLLFTGRKTRRVYFTKLQPGGTDSDAEATPDKPLTIEAVDVDSGEVSDVATITRGSIASINCDETLLLGSFAEREFSLQPGSKGRDSKTGQTKYAATGPDGKPLSYADAKEVRMDDRLEAKIPMEMFTVDVANGEVKTVHRATDWLNHLQFSPTDPNLIMFCHEGPWHKVDRIWTIRTDGSDLTKIHTRMMNMEIAGHEFFAPDGKKIWYDLQTPRGEDFWLASYDQETGKRQWFHLQRNEWSVHFNVAPDESVFAGDGGNEDMVAHAPDGKWIYLFKPMPIPDVAGIKARNAADLVSPGYLDAEKLVNMEGHDYRLEPNITFTPDMKGIVFSSNMHGDPHVYMVLIDRP